MDTDPDPFVFGPDTEMWRINRERCGLFFGPAAAILQVAHPRIAQGVHDHSRFRTDTLGRLRRTLEATNRIAFGRHSEAETTRQQLARVHARIEGKTAPGVPGPETYSAAEPDLLLWVLATLIVAALDGHEFVHGPLPGERKQAFYRDMVRFGTYFGVAETDCPAVWPEFEDYYESMIHGELLGSHPICAEVSRGIIDPRDSAFARTLGRLIDFLPVETLPEPVRSRLGILSTPWTRARMRVLVRSVPHWFPRLPARLRFYPEYRNARTSLAGG